MSEFPPQSVVVEHHLPFDLDCSTKLASSHSSALQKGQHTIVFGSGFFDSRFFEGDFPERFPLCVVDTEEHNEWVP